MSTKQSQRRTSVLADGTTVDQDYYQSKHYILAQLEQRKTSTAEDPKGSSSFKSNQSKLHDDVTKKMLKSGAMSEDDGWLLASMELPLRNPFCIANHPAIDQVKFYQKVFAITSVFTFMVALAILCWTWWWGILIKDGYRPVMPCGTKGDTFGVVRYCNDTSFDGNTELGDDGCDESAPLSVCVADSCINDPETDLRNCWSLGAFVMVVLAAYMLLLFRRDQAGKGLLSCACFIEGILAGASTLHYDSSLFLEFFTYLTCSAVMCLLIFTHLSKKGSAEWEKLPNQVGSCKLTVPDVEVVVYGAVKKSFTIGTGVVTAIALLWHVSGIRLTGGTWLAFFLAIFALWLSVGWIIREISWTQHKYDSDQYINMAISFHVDLYCIFILFTIFIFFVTQSSCSAGPAGCLPTCMHMCGVQGHRCANFICGIPGKGVGTGASPDGTAPAEGTGRSSKKSSQMNAEKEVETQEQWRRRKMINAGCAFGILALGGISFFAPQLSFAVALVICVGLPFFRAKQNNQEDQDFSNL